VALERHPVAAHPAGEIGTGVFTLGGGFDRGRAVADDLHRLEDAERPVGDADAIFLRQLRQLRAGEIGIWARKIEVEFDLGDRLGHRRLLLYDDHHYIDPRNWKAGSEKLRKNWHKSLDLKRFWRFTPALFRPARNGGCRAAATR